MNNVCAGRILKPYFRVPKFLIVRFSSIGDIVLTSPVIRCIKRQIPDAEVHFLSKSSFSAVLSGNPYIDKLHLVEKDLGAIIELLKKEEFDLLIDLHHNARTWLLKSKLGIPSVSYHKLNLEKWLMVNFKVNRLPDKHIVDRYLATVSGLGVKNDGEGLDFFIAEGSDRILSTITPAQRENFIAYVIGAKHNTKRLPAEKITGLCRKIKQPVILLGGDEDREMGELIAEESGEHVLSLCGKTTLHESAAVIRASSLVITHDTGLMHIAAALQKKIISVWGNTIPGFGMYPYYSEENGGTEQGMQTVVEKTGLSCRPCSKIGFEKCPKGHLNCLNMIADEEILRRISSQ